jgi:hypothetical protein
VSIRFVEYTRTFMNSVHFVSIRLLSIRFVECRNREYKYREYTFCSVSTSIHHE